MSITICDLQHALLLLCAYLIRTTGEASGGLYKNTNVIFILADDLGYGDLGFSPFNSAIMKSIRTPELEKFAHRGMTLTNFHTASPICSPSRASIMVGLFPWRLGVDFIYAGDLKLDGSEEMDHEQLPLIPNVAMSFHDAGYYTAHIGKWHLGGQSSLDIPRRQTGLLQYCAVPGINSYGFDEYVGMSEGTNSSRYWTHQRKNTYATGSRYLVRNDVPLPPPTKPEVLTDRQTEEAMRVIREQTAVGRKFFLNLWYDAPHSPWESIEPYFSSYKPSDFGSDRLRKYASMISNMDYNIGRLLALVDSLGIAENTLIFFTSDNGPENDAGSAGPFKGRKRLLAEGGIRVPAIVQWTGHIAPKSVSDKFTLTTDLFPSLLHAAKIKLPGHIRIDGVSQLSVWLGGSTGKAGDERVVLWYTHSIGYPKFTAAWSYGYKLLWADYEGRPSANLPPPLRVFDMRRDRTEDNSLLPALQRLCSGLTTTNDFSFSFEEIANLDRSTVKQGGDTHSTQAVLKLVSYLQMKMHLFRHLGETEFALFHGNKPFETEVSCDPRKSSVPTFTWTAHFLAPEFCGDAVYKELGPSFCRCALTNCSQHWYRPAGSPGAWAAGSVGGGLDGIIPASGTMKQYLKDVLQWSRFSPICSKVLAEQSSADSSQKSNRRPSSSGDKNKPLLLSSSSSSLVSLPICNTGGTDTTTDTAGTNENDGWAYGDLTGSVQAANSTVSRYQRHCHQRLHKRGKHVYLTGATCGADAPVLTINHHGMQAPLSLCPDSFEKVKRSPASLGAAAAAAAAYVDDNMMMFTLNDIMFGSRAVYGREKYLSVLRNLKSSSRKSQSSSPELLHDSQIAIIDPLFFHSISRWCRGDSTTMATTASVSLSDILGTGTMERNRQGEAVLTADSSGTGGGFLSSWGMQLKKNALKTTLRGSTTIDNSVHILQSASNNTSSARSKASACELAQHESTDFKNAIAGLGGFVSHFEKRMVTISSSSNSNMAALKPLSLVVMPVYENKIWSITLLVLRGAGTTGTGTGNNGESRSIGGDGGGEGGSRAFAVHYSPTGQPNPSAHTAHKVMIALYQRMTKSSSQSQSQGSSTSAAAGGSSSTGDRRSEGRGGESAGGTSRREGKGRGGRGGRMLLGSTGSGARDLLPLLVVRSSRDCSPEESGFHIMRFANLARVLIEVVGVSASNEQLLNAFRQLTGFECTHEDGEAERRALIRRFTEAGAAQMSKKQNYLSSMSQVKKFGKN